MIELKTKCKDYDFTFGYFIFLWDEFLCKNGWLLMFAATATAKSFSFYQLSQFLLTGENLVSMEHMEF